MKRIFLLLFLLPRLAFAQGSAIAGSTVTSTSASATSMCAGCPIGSTTPADNSGIAVASVTLKDALPSVTTGKLYRVGSAVFFSGLALATGSSISGTTGAIPKFSSATSLIDSNATISGANWTWGGGATLTAGTFSGSGTSLTGVGLLGVKNDFAASVSNDYIAKFRNTNTSAGTSFGLNVRGGTNASDTALLVQDAAAMNSLLSVDGLGNTAILGRVGIGSAVDAVIPLASSQAITNNYVAKFANTNTSAGTSYGLLVRGGTNASDDALTVQNAAANQTYLRVGGAGNIYYKGGGLTDSVGTPSITTPFAASGDSIAGTDYAFKVTVGNTTPSGAGVVTFGNTFTNGAICTISTSSITGSAGIVVTTSGIGFTATGATFAGSQVFYVLCRGY